jgi:hypothetical protein
MGMNGNISLTTNTSQVTVNGNLTLNGATVNYGFHNSTFKVNGCVDFGNNSVINLLLDASTTGGNYILLEYNCSVGQPKLQVNYQVQNTPKRH